jgi:hypothetical protein
MRILRRILGRSPKECMAKDLLKKSKAETSEIYGPLGNLGSVIVAAAWQAYQDVAKEMQFSIEGQPTEQQILAFYEILCFFIHMAISRAATQKLTEKQILKLQDYLGPFLSRIAVDTFFRHWPVESKKKIANEFLEKLNAAEADYPECQDFILKDMPFERESLFGKLAHNFAELLGSPSNPAVIMATKSSTVKAFTNMAIERSINDVAIVIDLVEPDTIAALRDHRWT